MPYTKTYDSALPYLLDAHHQLGQPGTLDESLWSGVTYAKAGTVLGKVTASGKYGPYNHSATNGLEFAVGILKENVTFTLDGGAARTDGIGDILIQCRVDKKRLTGYDSYVDAMLPLITFEPKANPSAVITILEQPAPMSTINVGSEGNLYTEATTTLGTLTYQWKTNSSASTEGASDVAGAITSTLTISDALTAGTYYYYCAITAKGVTVNTRFAKVVVVNATITVLEQPAEEKAVTFGSITGSLFAEASASFGTLTYQWKTNSLASTEGASDVAGATTSTLTISNELTADTYYYYCAITAKGVTVNTRFAKVVVVNATITVLEQPATETAVTANSITGSLFAEASASFGTVTYQWKTNSSASTVGALDVAEATTGTLTIPTDLAAGTTHYYYCVFTAGVTVVNSRFSKVVVSES